MCVCGCGEGKNVTVYVCVCVCMCHEVDQHYPGDKQEAQVHVCIYVSTLCTCLHHVHVYVKGVWVYYVLRMFVGQKLSQV